MNKLLNEFLNTLLKKQFSNNTIEAYGRDIKKFLEFVDGRKEKAENVNNISVMAYVQELIKQGKANSSIIRNVIAIRSYYKFLLGLGLISENPLIDYEVPKVKRAIPEILTVEEVDKFLNTPDINDYKGIRDKAMLELMYATGIKVSELLNLTIYNINLKLGYIKCEDSKRHERIIPIGSYAVNCLKEYIQIREKVNGSNSELLFSSLRGGKMTRQGFWKIVKMYANQANINKRINSYTLRHSFAVHLLQNGADIKSVQELLGHNTIATTQIYSNVTKQNKIIDVYKKAHPRA